MRARVPENRAFRYFLSVAGTTAGPRFAAVQGRGLMLGKATAVMDKILSISHSFLPKVALERGGQGAD